MAAELNLLGIRVSRWTFLAGLVFFLTGPELARAGFIFTKIADNSTPIPNGTGNFTSTAFPVLSGGNVAFLGGGSDGQEGIYFSSDGVLSRVVDRNTPVPGGTLGNFDSFLTLALSSSGVSFWGGPGNLNDGIYTSAGGTVSLVASANTPVPGGGGPFAQVGFGVARSGNDVVFSATPGGIDSRGIYLSTAGSLNRVADTTLPIPEGVGNFEDMFLGDLSAASVVFFATGQNFQSGIYLGKAGTVSAIADTSTPVPGGPGAFIFFGASPSISGNNIAFLGLDGSSDPGVYLSSGGNLQLIAGTNTPLPGGAGNFTLFTNGLSVSGSNVAFVAGDAQKGIYALMGGSLRKVIAIGDPLDGKTISGLGFGPRGLEGSQVLVSASFTDASTGVFLATLPEPSAFSSLAIGLVALLGCSRRRTRTIARRRRMV